MARILVVDDDEGVRSFIAESLETQNHHVTEAASGEEALKCLQTQSFHLLITDLRMPGHGGLQLLQKARSGWPDMEAIVLTAFGTVQSAVEAMKLGAFDFLQKPLPSPEALRLLVGRALERSSLRALRERVQRTDPPPQIGFRGEFQAESLTEVVQFLLVAGVSGRLIVWRRWSRGELWVHDGAVVHAELGERRGEPHHRRDPTQISQRSACLIGQLEAPGREPGQPDPLGVGEVLTTRTGRCQLRRTSVLTGLAQLRHLHDDRHRRAVGLLAAREARGQRAEHRREHDRGPESHHGEHTTTASRRSSPSSERGPEPPTTI